MGTDDVTKLRPVWARAGLDGVRLPDLLHFAATRLLAAGVPVKTVSRRLGHVNGATTLGVYPHFVEETDREAAATTGARLAGKQAPSKRTATRRKTAASTRR